LLEVFWRMSFLKAWLSICVAVRFACRIMPFWTGTRRAAAFWARKVWVVGF
jgi:hypothetical protein